VIRVLIADDHTLLRKGLRQLLSREFPTGVIEEAKDSAEALERITAAQWDLILLDINMPGRNGLEVLQESKRLRPATPVLVLSAYPEDQFAVRAFRAGASGYLNKQGAAEELLTAVKRVLAGGKHVSPAFAETLTDSLLEGRGIEMHDALSDRELQVLRMVAMGKSLKEIATELALSEKTVGTYRSRISQKMGLSTNVEITRYALLHQLVD
jgi:two-component system, NarL family, invasion response regulator UvrY